MKNVKRYERYQRQMILKELGEAGQDKLIKSKVVVIGAGGLGCPALQYLAAAGVGMIGVVDDDVVSLSNLHRQVLYNMNDIGFPKAECALKKLRSINNEIIVNAYNERLVNSNALDIIGQYDLVIDGTDNFSSRYMINDACVLLGKPLIYGAISKFEGQVAVFNGIGKGAERSTNYRDLFPVPPGDDEVFNCAEEGVLGVLPGIIGLMQANEAIKLITGIGRPLLNRLITYNALDNSMYELNLSVDRDARSNGPADKPSFLKTDYEGLCTTSLHRLEIEPAQFEKLIDNKFAIIIDVREKGELPRVVEFNHVQIPMDKLMTNQLLLDASEIVLFCQTGKRSLKAAKWLSDAFRETKGIYSLKGGIVNWKKQQALER